MAVDQAFEFVQQFLRAADAEGRDHDRAAVAQGVLDGGLEALDSGLAAFVAAVAVGAFQHDDVGSLGGFGCRQQGCVRGAEVAGEDGALGFGAVSDVDFYVGRAEDVAGALEAEAGWGWLGFFGPGKSFGRDARELCVGWLGLFIDGFLGCRACGRDARGPRRSIAGFAGRSARVQLGVPSKSARVQLGVPLRGLGQVELLPGLVVEWADLALHDVEGGADDAFVAGEADFQRVFDNQRQQRGAWLGAVDRAGVAGG